MMPKINEQIIQQKIFGSPKGMMACFIKLDKKWAIKLFKYEDIRDETYQNQKIAAEHGLGPDVGETIDFSEDMKYRYGYITEIVETVVPHEDINNDLMDSVMWNDAIKNIELFEEQKILRDKLGDLFHCYMTDLHPANLGYKNGQLICIDFGSEGMDTDFDYNNWF